MTDRGPDEINATEAHPVRIAVVLCVAAFMVSLDNLVVTTALPSIREDLQTGIEGLEWTVNAYTLTFAVFLLTAAAIADRFGRRRLFGIGLALFTAASALAALAPTLEVLVAARALQGVGAAVVLPLTLTMLSAAFPPEQRGAALGAWGAIGGLAVALGPVIGGLVVDSIAWQWIFWLNVPIGIVGLLLVPRWLAEGYGPYTRLDGVGTVLASLGLLGVVLALVRASAGWARPEVIGCGVAGVVVLLAFVWWETRTPAPMLPLRLFRNPTFSASNAASLFMYFGMFGSIFLIVQFLQDVQDNSPLAAGLRMLAWTGFGLIAAPVSGILSDRFGGKWFVVCGLTMQALGIAWLAVAVGESVSFLTLVPGFFLNGFGMGLYYGPVANIVMGSVERVEEGIASGANNAIREVGGVLGVAVLATIFTTAGGYGSGGEFVDGLRPALWVGAVVVAVGAATALLVREPRRTPTTVASAPPAGGAQVGQPAR